LVLDHKIFLTKLFLPWNFFASNIATDSSNGSSKVLQTKDRFPNPNGSLSSAIPEKTIAQMNTELEKALAPKKCGAYYK